MGSENNPPELSPGGPGRGFLGGGGPKEVAPEIPCFREEPDLESSDWRREDFVGPGFEPVDRKRNLPLIYLPLERERFV